MMGRLAGFRYKEVARKFRVLGFAFDRQARGSHEIWRHTESGRKATLVRHTRPIAEGTLRAILREAEIEVDDFLRA
jgi:predicted RNA binding protein YcfA (HicA-like mRNA interferase family)